MIKQGCDALQSKSRRSKGKSSTLTRVRKKQPSKSMVKKEHRRLVNTVKICPYCKQEFHPFNSVQKFCSMKCLLDYRHKIELATDCTKLKKCEYCGQEYKAWNYRAKYCSKECTYKARTRIKDVICPVCNKTFTQARRGQVYCSSYCIQEAKKGGRPQITFDNKSHKAKRVYLDNLWSEIVKLKADNQCEYCHKTEGLNSHHVFSRSNYPLRWDMDNGVCLCALHHILGSFSAHKAPLEFAEFIKKLRGIDWYNRLLAKAIDKTNDGTKTDRKQVKEILEQTKIKLLANKP